MDTFVIDTLPRTLAFPFDERDLEAALDANAALERVGMFFLYTSGIQVEKYDPLTCHDTLYPILALDDRMPTLDTAALARLVDMFSDRRDEYDLSGAARADAQLAGYYQSQPSQIDL